jgi:hypothetical protein
VFWVDLYEDAMRNPGNLYLFGKVAIPNPDDAAKPRLPACA